MSTSHQRVMRPHKLSGGGRPASSSDSDLDPTSRSLHKRARNRQRQLSDARQRLIELIPRLDTQFETGRRLTVRLNAGVERLANLMTSYEETSRTHQHSIEIGEFDVDRQEGGDGELRPRQRGETLYPVPRGAVAHNQIDFRVWHSSAPREAVRELLDDYGESAVRKRERHISRRSRPSRRARDERTANQSSTAGDNIPAESAESSSDDSGGSSGSSCVSLVQEADFNDDDEDNAADELEKGYRKGLASGTLTHLDVIKKRLGELRNTLRPNPWWTLPLSIRSHDELRHRVIFFEMAIRRGLKLLKAFRGSVESVSVAQTVLREDNQKLCKNLQEASAKIVDLTDNLQKERKTRLQLSLTGAGAADVHDAGGRSVNLASRWKAHMSTVVPPSKDVSIVVYELHGIRYLGKELGDSIHTVLRVFVDAVRTLLIEFKGYEMFCTGVYGIACFDTVVAAASFALHLQDALLAARWPKKVFSLPNCSVTYDDNVSAVIWRGPKVNIAIHMGQPFYALVDSGGEPSGSALSGTEHAIRSGKDAEAILSQSAADVQNLRTVYFGVDVDIAECMLHHCTQPGQTVISADAMRILRTRFADLGREVVTSPLLPVSIHPTVTAVARRPLDLFTIVSFELAARTFPLISSVRTTSTGVFSSWLHDARCLSSSAREFLDRAEGVIANGAALDSLPPTSSVALALMCVDIAGVCAAWETDAAATFDVVLAFVQLVRRLIPKYDCYEVIAAADHFTLLFSSSTLATAFAISLLEECKSVAWPDAMYSAEKFPMFDTETFTHRESDGKMTQMFAFKGPRPRIAIHRGLTVSDIVIDRDSSGEIVDVLGPGLHIVSALHSCARPGEILITTPVYDAIIERLENTFNGTVDVLFPTPPHAKEVSAECRVSQLSADLFEAVSPVYHLLGGPSGARNLASFEDPLWPLWYGEIGPHVHATRNAAAICKPLYHLWKKNREIAEDQVRWLDQCEEGIEQWKPKSSTDSRHVCPAPRAVIVTLGIDNAQRIWSHRTAEILHLANLFCSTVRSLIESTGGYEFMNDGDYFRIAFGSAIQAVRFSLLLQTRLLEEQWSDNTLTLRYTRIVKDGQSIVWRGPRCRIAIDVGHVVVDTISRRSDRQTLYSPNVMRKCQGLYEFSRAGDIVVSSSVFEIIRSRLADIHNPIISALGDIWLPGFHAAMTTYSILPVTLPGRLPPPNRRIEELPLFAWWMAEELQAERAAMAKESETMDAVANDNKLQIVVGHVVNLLRQHKKDQETELSRTQRAEAAIEAARQRIEIADERRRSTMAPPPPTVEVNSTEEPASVASPADPSQPPVKAKTSKRSKVKSKAPSEPIPQPPLEVSDEILAEPNSPVEMERPSTPFLTPTSQEHRPKSPRGSTRNLSSGNLHATFAGSRQGSFAGGSLVELRRPSRSSPVRNYGVDEGCQCEVDDWAEAVQSILDSVLQASNRGSIMLHPATQKDLKRIRAMLYIDGRAPLVTSFQDVEALPPAPVSPNADSLNPRPAPRLRASTSFNSFRRPDDSPGGAALAESAEPASLAEKSAKPKQNASFVSPKKGASFRVPKKGASFIAPKRGMSKKNLASNRDKDEAVQPHAVHEVTKSDLEEARDAADLAAARFTVFTNELENTVHTLRDAFTEQSSRVSAEIARLVAKLDLVKTATVTVKAKEQIDSMRVRAEQYDAAASVLLQVVDFSSAESIARRCTTGVHSEYPTLITVSAPGTEVKAPPPQGKDASTSVSPQPLNAAVEPTVKEPLPDNAEWKDALGVLFQRDVERATHKNPVEPVSVVAAIQEEPVGLPRVDSVVHDLPDGAFMPEYGGSVSSLKARPAAALDLKNAKDNERISAAEKLLADSLAIARRVNDSSHELPTLSALDNKATELQKQMTALEQKRDLLRSQSAGSARAVVLPRVIPPKDADKGERPFDGPVATESSTSDVTPEMLEIETEFTTLHDQLQDVQEHKARLLESMPQLDCVPESSQIEDNQLFNALQEGMNALAESRSLLTEKNSEIFCLETKIQEQIVEIATLKEDNIKQMNDLEMILAGHNMMTLNGEAEPTSPTPRRSQAVLVDSSTQSQMWNPSSELQYLNERIEVLTCTNTELLTHIGALEERTAIYAPKVGFDEMDSFQNNSATDHKIPYAQLFVLAQEALDACSSGECNAMALCDFDACGQTASFGGGKSDSLIRPRQSTLTKIMRHSKNLVKPSRPSLLHHSRAHMHAPSEPETATQAWLSALQEAELLSDWDETSVLQTSLKTALLVRTFGAVVRGFLLNVSADSALDITAHLRQWAAFVWNVLFPGVASPGWRTIVARVSKFSDRTNTPAWTLRSVAGYLTRIFSPVAAALKRVTVQAMLKGSQSVPIPTFHDASISTNVIVRYVPIETSAALPQKGASPQPNETHLPALSPSRNHVVPKGDASVPIGTRDAALDQHRFRFQQLEEHEIPHQAADLQAAMMATMHNMRLLYRRLQNSGRSMKPLIQRYSPGPASYRPRVVYPPPPDGESLTQSLSEVLKTTAMNSAKPMPQAVSESPVGVSSAGNSSAVISSNPIAAAMASIMMTSGRLPGRNLTVTKKVHAASVVNATSASAKVQMPSRSYRP